MSMMKLRIGRVYHLGDDFVRVLWIGDRLAVFRIWGHGQSEKEYGFEDSQEIAYCEHHFQHRPS